MSTAMMTPCGPGLKIRNVPWHTSKTAERPVSLDEQFRSKIDALQELIKAPYRKADFSSRLDLNLLRDLCLAIEICADDIFPTRRQRQRIIDLQKECNRYLTLNVSVQLKKECREFARAVELVLGLKRPQKLQTGEKKPKTSNRKQNRAQKLATNRAKKKAKKQAKKAGTLNLGNKKPRSEKKAEKLAGQMWREGKKKRRRRVKNAKAKKALAKTRRRNAKWLQRQAQQG